MAGAVSGFIAYLLTVSSPASSPAFKRGIAKTGSIRRPGWLWLIAPPQPLTIISSTLTESLRDAPTALFSMIKKFGQNNQKKLHL
ncbi:MAG: hypothetical protein CRN43_13355 [Candidatus Nephrothrix sp. EaCA]|nr:MAG: hypothetical protein CRN43_13355 [Candidatus Nephrothrix sp. EaCA]